MAAKKPAISTQLKAAKAEVESLTAQLAATTKSMESEKSLKEVYSKKADGLIDELDQLHGLLDSFPNVLPRRNESTYRDYSAMTRLASWLMANKRPAAE